MGQPILSGEKPEEPTKLEWNYQPASREQFKQLEEMVGALMEHISIKGHYSLRRKCTLEVALVEDNSVTICPQRNKSDLGEIAVSHACNPEPCNGFSLTAGHSGVSVAIGDFRYEILYTKEY